MAGCGLLTAAGLAGVPPRMDLAGNPVPSAGQVQAAQNKVNQRAAALGRADEQLAAANAKLTDLKPKRKSSQKTTTRPSSGNSRRRPPTPPR